MEFNLNKIFAKNKKIIIAIAVIIGLFIVIKFGKQLLWKIQNTFAVPNDSSTGTTTGSPFLTSGEKQAAESIAKALYDDMHGFNYLGHDAGPYQRMKVLSNKAFVYAYNYFNKKYGNSQTLKDWIDSELYYKNSDAGIAAVGVLDRIAALGLK